MTIKPPKSTYPWAELYDLESNPPAHRSSHPTAGRPPRPIKRTNVTAGLTDEERRILREVRAGLRARIKEVSNGQVEGLALRLLEELLLERGGSVIPPEEVNDWPSLLIWLKGN